MKCFWFFVNLYDHIFSKNESVHVVVINVVTVDCQRGEKVWMGIFSPVSYFWAGLYTPVWWLLPKVKSLDNFNVFLSWYTSIRIYWPSFPVGCQWLQSILTCIHLVHSWIKEKKTANSFRFKYAENTQKKFCKCQLWWSLVWVRPGSEVLFSGVSAPPGKGCSRSGAEGRPRAFL